jgi:hypothetical protein
MQPGGYSALYDFITLLHKHRSHRSYRPCASDTYTTDTACKGHICHGGTSVRNGNLEVPVYFFFLGAGLAQAV